MELETFILKLVTIKYVVTVVLALVGMVAVAILCHRLEKRIDAMDNLKDVEK